MQSVSKRWLVGLLVCGLLTAAQSPGHANPHRRQAALSSDVRGDRAVAPRRGFRHRLRSLGQGLRTTYRKTCHLGREACRRVMTREGRAETKGAIIGAARTSRRVVTRTAKAGAKWARENPAKAVGIGLGTAAMFGTAFFVAPALSGAVAQWATPIVGKTVGSILGTATGGALACGSRSLLVHVTPMVAKVDPFNAKQLATDTGMSATFGFFGFAQAAALKGVTAMAGVSGVGLFATNAIGLIGYEIGKDYLQNRIRNRVASDPKKFKDIWKSSLKMETVSNIARCIPGLNLETNFGAKVVGDIGGTIWWDRIVNERNPANKRAKPPRPIRSHQPQTVGHVHDALTE